jgi:hypothetical protein
MGRKKVQSAMYSISIVKLSAPATLGKMNTVTVLSNTYSLDDDEGMCLLYRLLSSSIWNQMRNAAPIERPCAALLCAPANFVEKDKSATTWEYVRNGTTSLVFKCKGVKGVRAVVEMTSARASEHLMRSWGTYLGGLDASQSTATFYLKVKTGATDRYWIENPADCYNRALDWMGTEDDFFKTYPVKPVEQADADRNYFVLMNDRGKRLYEDNTKLEAAGFPERYRRLWERTSSFSEKVRFCHGDIGEHNFLVDHDGEYVLIDWDEAQKDAPKPRLTAVGDEESALRHIEALRRKKLLYSDFQLAILYFRLKGKYMDENGWDIQNVPVLKACFESLAGKPALMVQAVQLAVANAKQELDME